MRNKLNLVLCTLLLVFGLMYLVLILPFRICDEPFHFFRIVEISQGELLSVKTAENTGAILPKNFILDFHITDLFMTGNQYHASLDAMRAAFAQSLENQRTLEEQSRFVAFPNTALYSPICYIPQALGAVLGRALHLTGLEILYLGRFFGLVFFVGIFGLILDLLHFSTRLKLSFFWLAGLPTALSQSASLSADSFTLSLSLLSLSLVFNLYHRFDIKKFRWLLVLAALLSCCKLVYFALPLVLIPKIFTEKKNSREAWWLTFALISSAVIPDVIWSLLVHPIYTPPSSTFQPSEQLTFFLTHLPSCLKMFAHTIYVKRSFYFVLFFGGLGWFDTHVQDFFLIVSALGLALIPLFSFEEIERKPLVSERAVMAIVLVGSYLLIFLSIYMSWNAVGTNSVEGIVARYFIPLYPLVFALYGKTILVGEKGKSVFVTLLLILWMSIQLDGAKMLILKYWS